MASVGKGTLRGDKGVAWRSYNQSQVNSPFPSSLLPLFQSESKCEIKMTLICMKMRLHAKLIFVRKVSLVD